MGKMQKRCIFPLTTTQKCGIMINVKVRKRKKIMFYDDDFGFDDDYVDDILEQFFSDENGVEIVLDSIIDDDTHISEIDDVEPTDADLDAIESELGIASV